MQRGPGALRGLARQAGHEADRRWWSAGYVLLPWLDALVRHPRTLDVVEDLIGPDILSTPRPFS